MNLQTSKQHSKSQKKILKSKKAELTNLETQIKTKKDELKANVDKELETYKETAKTEIKFPS